MGTAIDKLKNMVGSGSASSPSRSSASSSPSSSSTSAGTSTSTGDSYFTRHTTSVDSSLSGDEQYNALAALAEQRNREEAERGDNVVHGLNYDLENPEYSEYSQLRDILYEYGIVTEQEYNYGHFQNVAVAMGESCSHSVRFNSACKAATSFDCIEDLVLKEEFNKAVAEIFKNDSDPNWKSLIGNRSLLQKYGIAVVETSERQYSIAKVDENGNILKTKDGKLVQYYTNDMLMPDGQSQSNERNISEMLDAMGFDCLSALDFTPEEYKMIMEQGYSHTTASDFNFSNTKKVQDEVLGTYDKSTNTWSKAKKQNNTDWVNNTYIDKLSGKTTGKNIQMKKFIDERDNKHKYNRSLKGNSSAPTSYGDSYTGNFNGPSGNGYNGPFNVSNSSGSTNPADTTNPTNNFTLGDNMYGDGTQKTQNQGTQNQQQNEETTDNNQGEDAKKQQQINFNKLVEKYVGKGYTYKKAVSKAKVSLGLDYEYTGEKITKKQKTQIK